MKIFNACKTQIFDSFSGKKLLSEELYVQNRH